ncbi:EAL domain-containing protein [Deinococcus depolymerans]|uniref:EAL domain-containing protein n=1 Tax=Deinococcus depolymerans TaxID=392408 RepID=A0ABP3LID3_9DEIO
MLQSGLTFVGAFAQFSDGVALIDLDLKFRDANRALGRWLSHVSAAVPGAETLADLLHPADLPGHLRAVGEVLGGARREVSFPARLHPAQGPAWVSVTVSAVKGEVGVALLVVRADPQRAVVLDLQAQLAAVTAEAERWRLALNGSHDGVWDWYPERGTIYVSPAWKRILGYHRGSLEVTVDVWRDLIHPDDLPGLLPRYQQHVTLETSAYEFEHRMRHRSGRWVWVLLRGQVSAWHADGTPERVTGTLRDVTAQVRAREELQRTRDHLQAIMNAVPGLIGYKDRELRHQYGNVAYQEWYGRPHAELRGMHVREVIGEEMYRQNEPFMRAALAGTKQQFERHLTDAQGQERHVLFSYVPDLHDGEVRGMFVLAVDITSRYQAEQALLEEREWARTTLKSIGDGVITTDPHGQITFMNPVAENLTGWAAADSEGRPIEEVMHLSGAGETLAVRNPLRVALQDQRVVGMAFDTNLNSRTGTVRAIADSAAPIRRPDGTMLGGVIVFHDVSETRAMAVRMSHLAQHDPLTDLPNRVLLQDRIQQALARYRRGGGPFAVVFMDLDHFKYVNDSLGHHVGDELLRAVARRLCELVRETDTVSRQGGDEFVLLLTELRTALEVRAFTDRLEARLAEPYRIGEHVLSTSFSLGIAMCPTDGEDVGTLLRHADVAMYQAKAAGRGRSQFFSQELLASIEHRHRLVTQLRAALAQGAFTLHYQPKVNAVTGALMGVEALLRWALPDGTPVSPAEFIPAAEESGLILPLGQWVLEQACLQARAWQAALPEAVPVAVNISALQFAQPEFVSRVRGALAMSGLAPALLELEITESLLAPHPEAARERLQVLRDLGVRLSIDDFGTGFSSLSYLKLFPVHTLKIDRAFVRDVATDRNDVAIVEAVIGIGQAMNLEVLAEGVETPRQVEVLTRLGCAAMQGYHFARPMPADEMTDWIRRRGADH